MPRQQGECDDMDSPVDQPKGRISVHLPVNAVTHSVEPHERIDTPRGPMTGRDWLEAEKERLRMKGWTCRIETTRYGNLYLVRDT